MEVAADDIRVLVNSALRYALGRQSYITGLTKDILKRLPDEVWDNRTLSVARTDLERYFEDRNNGYIPDMDCDRDIWEELNDYLKTKEAKDEAI